MGILATMPRSRVAVTCRNASDFFGALLALALGFSLVGMVLVLAIPLIAVASLGWTILRRCLVLFVKEARAQAAPARP